MEFNAQKATIALDGDLADWDCLHYKAQTLFTPEGSCDPEVPGSCDAVEFENYAGGIWNGVDDNAMAFSFAWETGQRDNLYLGIKVVDESHQNSGSGWRGDSVQVVFTNQEQNTVEYLYNYGLSEAGDMTTHHERGPGGTQAR